MKKIQHNQIGILNSIILYLLNFLVIKCNISPIQNLVPKLLLDIISKEIEVINIINTFTNERKNITEEIKLFYQEVRGDNEDGLVPTKLNDVFIAQGNDYNYVEIVSTIMKRFDVNQDCVIDWEELNNGLLYSNNNGTKQIDSCNEEGFVIENNNKDENNEELFEQSRSSSKIGTSNNEVNNNIKLNFNYGGDVNALNIEEMNQHIKSSQNTDDDMIPQESHHNLTNKKVLLLCDTNKDHYCVHNHDKEQISK